MPTCPNGHPSDATDYCSVCGVEMNAAATPVSTPPPVVPGNAAPSPAAERCPICQAARDPAGGEFCEVCGHNFRTGVSGIPHPPDEAQPPEPLLPVETGVPPPVPVPPPETAPVPAPTVVRWELHGTVAAALEGAAPDPEAPTNEPPRLFPLDVEDALIGRRSPRRNLSPEVALDGDDGISHRHARLLRQPDGRFALLDLGSANGTRLNGTELPPNVLSAPLADGDRIELGRWTRLTVRVRP